MMRPRERLLSDGAQALSDAELLAIFLRSGSKTRNAIELSQDLLQSCGGMRALLFSNLEEFSKILKEEIVHATVLKEEDRNIEVIMCILSNYTPNCIVRAEVKAPISEMTESGDDMTGEYFAEKFCRAIRLAWKAQCKDTTPYAQQESSTQVKSHDIELKRLSILNINNPKSADALLADVHEVLKFYPFDVDLVHKLVSIHAEKGETGKARDAQMFLKYIELSKKIRSK